jgi:spore protease
MQHFLNKLVFKVNNITGENMGHSINLSKYKIRTDLAIETIENIENVTSNTYTIEDVKITEVFIDEKISNKIGKKSGNYITIEFDDITDYDNGKKVENIFSKTLYKLLNDLNLNENQSCLVVGLGNCKSTPDALGPLTIENILVTNHLFSLSSPEEGFRPVSVIIPGVMGQTGLETSEIINAIVKKFKPDFVIVIDALASKSLQRVNKTIQITDTGIHPGSGVGNSRKEISKDTLNIPCIAIGIPTVVDAITIVSDTINYMQKHYSYSKANIDNPINKLMVYSPNYLNKKIEVTKEDKEALLGMVGSLNENEIRQLLYEVLTPIGFNLMVTVKEVDFLIEKLSLIIGNGINKSLHKQV